MDILRTFEGILIAILVIFTTQVFTLQVDNQLVAVKSDCFERIALGAMLPFEKTFRNIDTNSLKSCQEFCVKEGEKCQTIAFGVHVRGNGTCQLSSEKIDASMTRPEGTIFDPDFDLYARKENCFDIPPDANTIPTSVSGLSDDNRPGASRPPLPFGPINPINGLPQLPSSSLPPTSSTILTDIPDDRFSPRPSDRYPPDRDTRLPSTDHDNRFPTTDFDRRYPTTNSDNRYPSTEYDRRPSNGYDVKEDGYSRPSSGSYPTRRPSLSYPSYDSNLGNGYSNRDRDKIYFSHDLNPLYKYPMLYEQNYPSPNDQSGYPAVYAQNIPTVEDRYKPLSFSYGSDEQHSTPRPIYGLGYGSGYSYGTPTSYGTTPKPGTNFDNINYGQNDRRTPPIRHRPSPNGNGYGVDNRQPRPDNNQNGNRYHPQRPVYSSQDRPSYGPTSVRPLDNDYVHRPDPSYSPNRGPESGQGNGYSSDQGPHSKPADPYSPRPEQGQGSQEAKPGNHFSGTGGYDIGGGSHGGNRYPDTDSYRGNGS